MSRSCRIAMTVASLAAAALLLPTVGASGAVDLKHCNFAAPKGLCGTVDVPLDRSQPGGAKIGIKFVLFRRTNTSKPSLGSIFVTEGGPGAPATAAQDPYHDFVF